MLRRFPTGGATPGGKTTPNVFPHFSFRDKCLAKIAIVVSCTVNFLTVPLLWQLISMFSKLTVHTLAFGCGFG